jgi:magnesium-protoporphyrin O-methyltransferase
MDTPGYQLRRGELMQYFDRTAADAWARLTSNEPVGRIRATVRAGRERMRATLLSYLPEDLTGQRVLDAGCGTGALALELARRGADVVATDLSPVLVGLARERWGDQVHVDFRVADMLDPSLGRFDWIVAMDSMIHYEAPDMVQMLALLAARASRGVVFTFAPKTPLLSLMHLLGQLFPRGNRSPAIEPIAPSALRGLIDGHADLAAFARGRSERVSLGFYISQSMELVRR